MKGSPNYFKVPSLNNAEELAESLNTQLTEAIAENIRLTAQLRVLSNNYNDVVKDYLEMSIQLDKFNNNNNQ